MNGFRGRKHKSESSVSLKTHLLWLWAAITYLGENVVWRQLCLFLLSPSPFCISKLLVCFPSYKLPLREGFTPVERATISRRPLLFLLYLPPQLSRLSTPPPSLAEWQYHLPPDRKRWTVNLGQSAVKNMTHSSIMKTWQTHTQTHCVHWCT